MKENPDSGRVIRTSEYPLYNNDYYKAWKSRTEMESINLASFILNRKFLVVKLLFLKFFRGPKLNHNPNSSVSSRRIVRPDLGHVYDVIRINSEIGGTNFYYNFGKKITIFKVKQTNIELTMHKSILNQLNIYCLTENHKAYISNGYGHLEIQDYVGEIPESITYLEFNNA
jgi:hypothetical protein